MKRPAKQRRTTTTVSKSKSSSIPSDPRYAAISFFDPLAPKPAVANVDPATFVVEPAALTAAPGLNAEGRCTECYMVVDLSLRIPHLYWCSWWDSPEGKAHELPF